MFTIENCSIIIDCCLSTTHFPIHTSHPHSLIHPFTHSLIHSFTHSNRTTHDRAYRMLHYWREEIAMKRETGREGGARQVLMDVLETIGCEKSAEFLMIGTRDMLWK